MKNTSRKKIFDPVISILYIITVQIASLLIWFIIRSLGPFSDIVTGKRLEVFLMFLMVLFSIGPLIIASFVLSRNFELIGFQNKGFKKAVRIGFAGALPIVVLTLMNDWIVGYRNINTSFPLNYILFSCLSASVVEEILFRVYLQTSLNEIISKRWVAIAVGAVAFSLSHIPFDYIQSGETFVKYLAAAWFPLILFVFYHIYLYCFYKKTNNIITSIIIHIMINLSVTILV